MKKATIYFILTVLWGGLGVYIYRTITVEKAKYKTILKVTRTPEGYNLKLQDDSFPNLNEHELDSILNELVNDKVEDSSEN